VIARERQPCFPLRLGGGDNGAVAWGAHLKKPVTEKIRQPALGPQLQEQARGTVETDRGDQGFQRAPKELLVALGSGAEAIDEQVSPGHGGDKAGVAGACGETPRRVAAS
jgi:hypothetical protein